MAVRALLAAALCAAAAATSDVPLARSLARGAVASSAPDCKTAPALYPEACCNVTLADVPAAFNVTFQTTVKVGDGSFTLAVTKKASPWGVARFYNLARCQYFSAAAGVKDDNADGFFRVVTGFVTQFGIAGAPAISNAWANEVIPNDPVVLSNVRGTISYAAEQDASGQAVNRTTQVYINLGDNARLDPLGFAPFGVVQGDGMKVVDAIYAGYAQEPDQDSIYAQGDAYLHASFPKLDYITGTTVSE